MGQNASKKNNTAQTSNRPAAVEPKLPGHWKSLVPAQPTNPLRATAYNAPSISAPDTWRTWMQDFNKFKSEENQFQSKIQKQADDFRKNHEFDLEKLRFNLKLQRAVAENGRFIQTSTTPKPTTVNSFLSIIPRLQSHKENDAKYFPIRKRRPELTDEMVRHIQMMKCSPQNELLTEIDGVQILGKDIRTLIGLNWLNDEIINAYMTLLVYRGTKAGYKLVHSFNTFFYPKLREAGYSSVRRWTRKVDIFSYDYIIVPVHLGNHWTLVFIDFKQKTISYYDSLGGYHDGHCDILLDYLRSEMSDKKKQELSDSGWRLLNRSSDGIPQQNNCSDCGVFTCIYAEHLTRQAELDFSQEDMPYYRDRMIYEITTQRILE